MYTFRRRKQTVQESLYVRILVWAFEQRQGFSEQQLLDEFDIKGGTETYQWYQHVFRFGTNDNPAMLVHFCTRRVDGNDIGFQCLSEKGMSAAIDYLELREARESSRKAMFIATGSLILATLVGIAQICVQVWY